MNKIDDATLREWLHLELDGELAAADGERLRTQLAGDEALRGERRRLRRLNELLAAARIQPREGFSSVVMGGLPRAPWEARGVAGWPYAVALLVALGAVAGGLLGSGLGALDGGSGIGTLATLFDFAKIALLTGAGLLSASWRGAGLLLEESLVDSPLTLVALGTLVLGVNLLFLRLLARGWRPVAPGKAPPAD